MKHSEQYREKPYKRHEEEDSEALAHKREVKRLIEERIERKRLKDELEDFDGELEGEFDWDNIDY